MKSKLQLFSIIITSIFLASCATTGGHVASGIYNSPLGNFSVPLPKLGMGTKIQEQSFENSGYVSFHDDFGSLRSIEYSQLPANAVVDYRDLIHRVVLPDIQSRFPGSKMLHEEPLNQDRQKEYFFVLQIPGGSPLVDMKTGKALDSTRAYLYFMSGGYIYSLSAQEGGLSSLLSNKDKPKEPKQTSFNGLRNTLQAFKMSMQLK